MIYFHTSTFTHFVFHTYFEDANPKFQWKEKIATFICCKYILGAGNGIKKFIK